MNPFDLRRKAARGSHEAFTLVEVLVSMVVLTLLLVLVVSLLNSAMLTIATGDKHMDADAQARAVFDRMAIDFGQIVKRPDVDYVLKDDTNVQTGNDQLAFFSQVPGFYPTGATVISQAPVSLVAYRVGVSGTIITGLQRLGTGLTWDNVANGVKSVVFSASSTTKLDPALNTIVANWPTASNASADNNYELAGPQIFRMEYGYVLKGQTAANGTVTPAQLSSVPWNVSLGHTSVNGLQDVGAIIVMIAIVDAKSRVLVPDTQLTTLAGAMLDFSPPELPSTRETQWQNAINTSTLSRSAAAGIRLYHRYFYLPTASSNP